MLVVAQVIIQFRVERRFNRDRRQYLKSLRSFSVLMLFAASRANASSSFLFMVPISLSGVNDR